MGRGKILTFDDDPHVARAHGIVPDSRSDIALCIGRRLGGRPG